MSHHVLVFLIWDTMTLECWVLALARLAGGGWTTAGGAPEAPPGRPMPERRDNSTVDFATIEARMHRVIVTQSERNALSIGSRTLGTGTSKGIRRGFGKCCNLLA